MSQGPVLGLSFPPLLKDCSEDIEGVSLTRTSKLGGAASVVDDTVTLQNESCCAECQPSTNQMSKLMG